jgi:cullin-associated NEDD8-dissociated protein 1
MTLSILINRFPAMLSSLPLDPQPFSVIAPLLSHSRPAVRKRAITTLAQFVPISNPELFTSLLQSDMLPSIASGNVEKQLTTIQLVAAVARQSPAQIAPVLSQIVPGVLKALLKDNEDLRESALQALEALVLRCPAEVTPFLSQIIQAGTNYIKFDPVRVVLPSLLGISHLPPELRRRRRGRGRGHGRRG